MALTVGGFPLFLLTHPFKSVTFAGPPRPRLELTPMKIAAIEAIPVCVPLKAGLTTRTAHGEHAVSTYVIVKVHTDEGITGLGEATVSALWSGETAGGCVAAIRDLLAPALTGLDPRQITAIRARMDFLLKLNPFAKSAIEMALWDILGKAVGRPVYQLLGGKVREEVPIKMMIGAFDAPAATKLAELFLSWGVDKLKVKVGLDPKGDIERVKAVRRAAGPDIPIGVDGNCGWTVATARRTIPLLDTCNLLFIEQPIPVDDPQAWCELRRVTTTPLMADESAFHARQAWQVATYRAVDIISVYPGKNGGISATVEAVHAAKAAGLTCCMGSNLELGIATAAMLHTAIALPGIRSEEWPADIIGPLYHETCLLKEPLTLGPKAARVPEGPGLGVELDEKELNRRRIDK